MERCFTHREDGSVACENVEKEVAKITSDISMMLWHGPPCSGKSSLAFQYAFDVVRAATRTDLSTDEPLPFVVLVCHESVKGKAGFVPIQPCDSCQTPVKSGRDVLHWERIRIKYLKNAAELCHFACSFHLLGGRCIALIVDDFDLFWDDSPPIPEVYRCLAFLKDTVEYMQHAHGEGQVVVVSSTSAFFKQERHRMRRWFPLLLELVPHAHANTFAMQEELPSPQPPASLILQDWAAYMPHFPVPYRIIYAFEPNSVKGGDGFFRFLHAG
ncbi:hypothetical protein LEN26_000483 [Aphanomyces euteiches]|nr:hypothetical protein AeMF1_002167 [Aphanomyces euteiches]KAH9163491.1 hypothetical protein LEN26_000483 [Aphanomyces euteiches]KAH9191086.1 hypothetical protein AeNC1_006944 [Aphanomyces euteiches]